VHTGTECGSAYSLIRVSLTLRFRGMGIRLSNSYSPKLNKILGFMFLSLAPPGTGLSAWEQSNQDA